MSQIDITTYYDLIETFAYLGRLDTSGGTPAYPYSVSTPLGMTFSFTETDYNSYVSYWSDGRSIPSWATVEAAADDAWAAYADANPTHPKTLSYNNAIGINDENETNEDQQIEIDAMATDVANAVTMVGGLATDVAELQSDVAELETVEGGFAVWASDVESRLGTDETDIDGLDSRLAAAEADLGDGMTWSQITGKPSTFTPSTHSHTASDITDFSTAADARITAQKGSNNGLAPLDSGGKVAAAYLPSYVDDVLEYANTGAFPGTGEAGKIYVATGTGLIYRWSGSAYVNIAASPGSTDSVTEGSTNLYFTNERAQDAVLGVISASNGVTFTYNDSGNSASIAGVAPTTNNNVSRSLNSNYTISSNVMGVFCTYSINASWNLSALISGSGSAFLEYSVDNGSNWITVNQVSKGLNLLTFAGNDDMTLSGFIPHTATTTRIRTTSTNMTITYVRGQEVLK